MAFASAPALPAMGRLTVVDSHADQPPAAASSTGVTLGEARAAHSFMSHVQAAVDKHAASLTAPAATGRSTMPTARGADPLPGLMAQPAAQGHDDANEAASAQTTAPPIDMARLENEAVLFVRTSGAAAVTRAGGRRSRHVRAHIDNRVEQARDRVPTPVTVEQLRQCMTRLRAFMQDAIDTLIENRLPLVEQRLLYVPATDKDCMVDDDDVQDEQERRREASVTLLAIWRRCSDADKGYGLYLDHVFEALECERTDGTAIDERTCFAVLLSIFYAYLRRDGSTSVQFVHSDVHVAGHVELPAVVFAHTPFAAARRRALQSLLSMLPPQHTPVAEDSPADRTDQVVVRVRVSDVCDAHDPLSNDNQLYRLLRFASFVQARVPVLYMLDMPELYPCAWRSLIDAVTTANEKLIALFEQPSSGSGGDVPRRATILQQRDEFFELPPCPWMAAATGEHYTYAQVFDWMFGIIDQVGSMCARHCGAAYLEYECRVAAGSRRHLERTLRAVASRPGFTRLEHVARAVRRTQSFVSPKELATFLDDIFSVDYRRMAGYEQYVHVPAHHALLDAVWAASTQKQYTELSAFLAYVMHNVPRDLANLWHVVAHLGAQQGRDVHGMLREQYVQALCEAFHRRVLHKWIETVRDEMLNDAATRTYAFPVLKSDADAATGRLDDELREPRGTNKPFVYVADAFRRSLGWLRDQCMLVPAQRLIVEHRWGELYDELHPTLHHAAFRVCVSSLEATAAQRPNSGEPPERIATPVLVRFPGRLMAGDIGTLVHGDNVVRSGGASFGGAAGAAAAPGREQGKRSKRSGRTFTMRYGMIYCAPADDDAERKQSNTTIVFVDSRECMRAAQSPTGAIDLATVRTHSLTKPTGSKKLEVMLFDNARGKYFWVPWNTIQERFRWYNRLDGDLPDTYKLASPPSTAWMRKQRIDNLRVRAGVRMIPHTVYDQGTDESYTFDVPLSIELNEALNRRFLQRAAIDIGSDDELVQLALQRCRAEHVLRSGGGASASDTQDDAAAIVRCALRYVGALFSERGPPTLDNVAADAAAERWRQGRVTKWSIEAHDRLDEHVAPLHHQTLHVPMHPVAVDAAEASRSAADEYDLHCKDEAAASDETAPSTSTMTQVVHVGKASARKYGAFARFTRVERSLVAHKRPTHRANKEAAAAAAAPTTSTTLKRVKNLP